MTGTEQISLEYPFQLKHKAKIKGANKVIILSIIAGLSASLVDAIIDSFIFHDGPFLDQAIFAVPEAEIYFRSYILASFIVFGIVFSRILARRKKVEQELRESQEKLQNIFAASPNAITVSDLNGNIIECNLATLDMLEFSSKQELIGKNGFSLIARKDQQRAAEHLKRTLEQGFVKNVEYTFVTKNGREISAELSASVLKDASGNPTSFVSITKDITERQRAEETLLAERDRLETVTRNIGAGLAIVSKDYHTLWANEVLKQIFGDVEGKICYSTYNKRNEICPGCGVRGILETGKGKVVHEQVGKDVNGKTVWSEITATPIRDKDGNITAALELVVPITERKKMEEALRESEEKYRTQFEEALDAIFVADAETGIIIDCNRAASELVGREKSELVGKHQRILHPPEEIKEGFSRTYKQHINEKEGQVLETQVITKSREIKDVAIKASVYEVRGKKLIQGIFHDITGRKRAEETIRESEEKYRNLFENARDVILTLDLKGNVTSVNKMAEEYGFKTDQITGKNMLNFFSKRQWPILMKDLLQVIRGNPVESEVEIITSKGKRAVEYRSNPIRQGDKVVGLQTILRDVTERKEMEEKLRQYSEHLEELVQKRTAELWESEKRYSVLVEEAGDGVLILQDEKVVFSNKKVSDILGYSRDELEGLPLEKLVYEKYLSLAKKMYERNLRGDVTTAFEVEWNAKNGEHISIEVSGAHIHYRGRPAVLRVARDIRDRRQMEEQRLKLEKLAAIGELATMVGHDLRNPLQSIENAIYCLRNEATSTLGDKVSPKAKEMLEVIDDSVSYADKIVTDLQDFSATRTPRLEKTDINAIIKETLSQVKPAENLELRTELECVPEIIVDKDQMKRVFLNLTTNGIQAMENGGTLTISTKKTEGFAEVIFKDTGTGITKEDMKKLFTPFFTTKAKGLGMGLPICKKFVDMHGGTIQAKSEVGKGTAFTVKLPITQENGGEKT